jgi:hypothetical protein
MMTAMESHTEPEEVLLTLVVNILKVVKIDCASTRPEYNLPVTHST